MARINKGALTKLEIVNEATKQFLEKGFTHTTVSSVAKALNMSTGNLTFHYPTKEHLLAELTDMLCGYQWEQMEREANEGISSILAICLELTAMTGACEDDEIIKDFLISSYASPICLSVIRRNDVERAKKVFGIYRPDWTDEQYAEAEILVSGIEFATLMTAGDPVPFEMRISGAINNILGIYGVPVDVRETKLKKVFAKDYRNIGKRVISDFKNYVAGANEQSFRDILHI